MFRAELRFSDKWNSFFIDFITVSDEQGVALKLFQGTGREIELGPEEARLLLPMVEFVAKQKTAKELAETAR